MTAKDKFLKRLEDQIKLLEDAYDYNKLLPENFFENLEPISKPVNFPTLDVAKPSAPIKIAEDIKNIAEHLNGKNNTSQETGKKEVEYGGIKKAIIGILAKHNKAMLKSEIMDKMKELNLIPESAVLNTVTNALANLNNEGEIKGYKPAGLKFRGYFWTLDDWWKTDLHTDKVTLPLEHEPYAGKLKTFE